MTGRAQAERVRSRHAPRYIGGCEMQAMNGSAVSFRSQGRLVGCLMVLVLALSAIVLAPGVANAQEPADDDVPGPWRLDLLRLHGGTVQQPLPDGVAVVLRRRRCQRLHQGPRAKRASSAKASGSSTTRCPGETSNGLIGENEARWRNLDRVDLEVEGKPAKTSRLADTRASVTGTRANTRSSTTCRCTTVATSTPKLPRKSRSLKRRIASIELDRNSPVKAITLNIGSNDELAAITQCKDEVTL